VWPERSEWSVLQCVAVDGLKGVNGVCCSVLQWMA